MVCLQAPSDSLGPRGVFGVSECEVGAWRTGPTPFADMESWDVDAWLGAKFQGVVLTEGMQESMKAAYEAGRWSQVDVPDKDVDVDDELIGLWKVLLNEGRGDKGEEDESDESELARLSLWFKRQYAHIDLQAGKAPKFSTHSLRREADTAARRLRVKSETTEPEIDIYFGWNERVLLKAMQVHYENLSIRARMALAKITGWL